MISSGGQFAGWKPVGWEPVGWKFVGDSPEWAGRAGHVARSLGSEMRRTAVLLEGLAGDLGEWSGPLRASTERTIRELASDLAGIGATLSWRGGRVAAAADAAAAAAGDPWVR